ncbi:MAG: PssD/Cps14F family polysaccharide biosynthesis glycosyltransferase [Tissierella sp.]|uniref:PssD/Cps14F family polysaccharide biosynthesis glycosyltransferase n=1 Tax=Tissierella sp. TaxID=41274 RepID=UPI003F9A71F4
MNNSKPKIIMISSSGGHYEQLSMLKSLEEMYDLVWITEKTTYKSKADYYFLQTGTTDKFYLLKMIWISIQSLHIWIKEKPDFIISTGAILAIPISLLAKILKKKVIFIESFARIENSSKTGRFFYNFADLFIVQWETLKTEYPSAIYGGSIY